MSARPSPSERPVRGAPPVAAVAAAAAFAAFVAVWGVSTLWWPLGGDQAVFAWIGDVVLDGGQPYRDAWETKGPFAFYLSALARGLFGRGQGGLRAFDFLLLVGTLVALGRVAAAAVRAGGGEAGHARAAGWVAAALHFVMYAEPGYWHTAQPEAWGTAAVAWGVALLVAPAGGPAGRAAPVAAAALIGSTALLKPFFGAFALLPLLAVLLPPGRATGPAPEGAGDRRWRPPWGRVMAVVAAAAVPALLCLAWLAAHGVLAEYARVHLLFNAQVYAVTGAAGAGPSVRTVIEALGGTRYGLLWPLAAAGLVHLWRHRRATAVLLGAWLVVAAALVVVQRRFWNYQWIPLLAPLTVLTAAGGAWLLAALARPAADGPARAWVTPARALAGAWAVAVASTWLVTPVTHVAAWLRFVTGGISAAHWASYFPPTRFGGGPGSLAEVGRYVRARTRPDDRVLTWSHQPALYPLAGRAAATRYGFLMPLVLGPPTARQRAERATFLREIAAARPAYVIVVPEDRIGYLPLPAGAYLPAMPAFGTWLATHYRPDTTIGDATLYRRRD